MLSPERVSTVSDLLRGALTASSRMAELHTSSSGLAYALLDDRGRSVPPLDAAAQELDQRMKRKPSPGQGGRMHRPTSSHDVRRKYLANLGVVQPTASNVPANGSALVHATPPTLTTLNGGQDTTNWWQRALVRIPRGDSFDASAELQSDGLGKRNVRFNDMVEVRYVPMHTEYSGRVRQKYWNSAEELWDMAARNSLEFAAEGFDWTKVVEDQDLIPWGEDRIHPVHLQGPAGRILQARLARQRARKLQSMGLVSSLSSSGGQEALGTKNEVPDRIRGHAFANDQEEDDYGGMVRRSPSSTSFQVLDRESTLQSTDIAFNATPNDVPAGLDLTETTEEAEH